MPRARPTSLRNGVTGTLVDPDELEEFADALEAYARDPELRRRHGEGGTCGGRDDGLGLDQRQRSFRVYKHAIVKRERLERMTGR